MKGAALLVAVTVLTTGAAFSQADSPFAVERGLAERLLASDPERLVLTLASPAPLKRLTAARAAASVRLSDESLATTFATEPDPRVRLVLADVVARAGEGAIAVAARKIAGDATRNEELRHVRVLAALDDIIAANTDPAGDFKGFYDGQFEAVSRIDGAAPGTIVDLAATASAVWRPDTLRRAAIRALGALGGERARAALVAIREEALTESGLQDPEALRWRVPTAVVERYAGSPRFLDIDHARAACGDRAGLRWRLGYHHQQRRRFIAALVYVPESKHPVYRSAAAWETFEIAYLHGRLGEREEAREYYGIVLSEYGETAPAPTAHYNLACLASREGDVDAALEHLRGALDSGYADLDWMKRDADLETVRRDPRFGELMR